MLHRRSFIASGLLSSITITIANAFGAQGSTLQVHVTYAGSGTVDDAHKLYVAVWDTPDFVKEASGTTPIALKFVTAKSALAEFTGLDIRSNRKVGCPIRSSAGNIARVV